MFDYVDDHDEDCVGKAQTSSNAQNANVFRPCGRNSLVRDRSMDVLIVFDILARAWEPVPV